MGEKAGSFFSLVFFSLMGCLLHVGALKCGLTRRLTCEQ
jgi:hypothetical protein